MAIAFIQEAHGSVAFTLTNTVTISASTAGSLIVVPIALQTNHGAITVASITDNLSQHYSQATGAAANMPGDVYGSDIWYMSNSAAGVTTITITLSTSGGLSLVYAVEYSGASVTPFDGANAASSLNGSVVGPSLTTTVDGDVLVTIAVPRSITITGISSPGDFLDNFSGNGLSDYVGPPAGTYQAIFAPTTNDQFASSVAAFSPGTTSGDTLFLVF
jgi:hypothetical protein